MTHDTAPVSLYNLHTTVVRKTTVRPGPGA